MTSPQQNCDYLLKLAQAQGYEARLCNGEVRIRNELSPQHAWDYPYNPAENAEQLVELIKNYKMDIFYIETNDQWEAEVPNTATETAPDIFAHADTLEEAIIQAALKVIGE